jgi:hypothetical protein
MWIFRIIQILLGLFLLAEAVSRNGLILKKLYKDGRHRVDRLLLLTGAVILLIVGIWGKLPKIW